MARIEGSFVLLSLASAELDAPTPPPTRLGIGGGSVRLAISKGLRMRG